MNRRAIIKGKKAIRLFVIVGVIVGIGVVLIMKNRCGMYREVVSGISYEEAVNYLEEGQDYYIVRISNYNTGSRFAIDYGENKDADVELTGNTPYSKSGKIFRFGNCFLVKGKDYNEQNLNKEFSEVLPNIYSIEVEEWKIITPIKRDYTYSKHSRWFYPKNFIDQYDVEKKDYTP